MTRPDAVQHVWLVRHGQQDRERDPGLTARGSDQAEAVMRTLAEAPIRRIVVSPRRRTRETAAGLIGAHPVAGVEVDDRARERIEYDPEVIDATSWRVFREEWDRTERDRDHVPPEGDSSRRAAARLRCVIDDWLPQDGDLVVITHGGVTLDLLRDLLPDLAIRALRGDVEGGLHHGSITRLDVTDGGIRVAAVGTTAHLD